jgi:hypothetical protein
MVVKLSKQKVPKAKRSIAETLARDLQWIATEKLAMFEKLRERGAFEGADRRELPKLENSGDVCIVGIGY